MRVLTEAATYRRLSAYYFFYFATLGALLPFWGLYLQYRGFSVLEIGGLTAVLAATKIIAPYIWGWLADSSGRRTLMIRAASFVSAVCFCGVYIADGLIWMALVMALFSFFWNAGLPQFEAATLNFLGDQHHRYSSIRLWGSIGFILAVLGAGAALDSFGIEILPHILLVLYLGIWLTTLWMPADDRDRPASAVAGPIIKVLRRPAVVTILLACFLMQLSFGPYYTYFSIYLEDHAYSKSLIGALWSGGVLAEIIVFIFMYRLLPVFGAKALMLWCFLLAAVRWVLIGYGVESVLVLCVAQLLHAFSFGMFHAVMIHMIHGFFRGHHQGRGQALYSSLSFGAGGALGSLLGGQFWASLGPVATFNAAAVIAVCGFLIVYFGLRAADDPQQRFQADTVSSNP